MTSPGTTVQASLEELFSLEGLAAVVTGGSSGIGRAIAGALAGAGARVVVVARREPELRHTVEELTAAGGAAAWVRADLGTRAGVPEDFAAPAVFLAGRGSGYVTGQAIAVDGGFSVH